MSKQDRLDMLKKISFIHGDDISIFEAYIPNHYNEIYSLYTLLKDSKINYDDIKFKKPLLDNNTLTFVCECKDSIFHSIRRFLEKNDDIISYTRKHKYLIELYYSSECENRLLIKFVKI